MIGICLGCVPIYAIGSFCTNDIKYPHGFLYSVITILVCGATSVYVFHVIDNSTRDPRLSSFYQKAGYSLHI